LAHHADPHGDLFHYPTPEKNLSNIIYSRKFKLIDPLDRPETNTRSDPVARGAVARDDCGIFSGVL